MMPRRSPEQQEAARKWEEEVRSARLEQLKQILEVEGMGSEGYKEYLENILRDGEKSLFGWTNETATLDKVNDVEVYMASGYDLEFIHRHHAVRDLLDANSSLGGPMSLGAIYEALRAGHDGAEEGNGILANVKEEDGSARVVDLYDQVHLNRIISFVQTLHPEDRQGLTDRIITEKYWNDEPIQVTMKMRDENGDVVQGEGGKEKSVTVLDLRKYEAVIPRISIPQDEFEAYYDVIEENQPGFQWLSTLRDPSIMGHHAENGGHAQLLEALDGVYTYVPVNGRMAAQYVRADVRKTSTRHRAGGHPHEIGGYEENTGTLVSIEKEAYMTWRGGVTDYRAHEGGAERTYRNILGMNSAEETMLDKQEKTFWFGRRVDDNGVTRKSLIYTAMHQEHDERMERNRGFKLTEKEAGDKIITDVVGKIFAMNQRDWLMTMAKLSDGMYDTRDVFMPKFLGDDKAGIPTFVFYAKKPRQVSEITRDHVFDTSDQYDYGEVRFKGVTAFAKYINWRIRLGDIPEISEPIDENFLQSMQGEEKVKQEAGDDRTFDRRKDLPKIASYLRDVLGAEASSIIEVLSGNASPFTKNVGGTYIEINGPDSLRTYLMLRMGVTRDKEGVLHIKPDQGKGGDGAEDATEEEMTLRTLAKDITNEVAPTESAKQMIKILQRIMIGDDRVTPEALQEKINNT